MVETAGARYGGTIFLLVKWKEQALLISRCVRELLAGLYATQKPYQLAQWAGSRADLFPSRLCQRLGETHSHGKPHSLHHTKKVIEKVFQRPFEEVFEEFDERPIGTGAIAQVCLHPISVAHTLISSGYRSTERP